MGVFNVFKIVLPNRAKHHIVDTVNQLLGISLKINKFELFTTSLLMSKLYPFFWKDCVNVELSFLDLQEKTLLRWLVVRILYLYPASLFLAAQ